MTRDMYLFETDLDLEVYQIGMKNV